MFEALIELFGSLRILESIVLGSLFGLIAGLLPGINGRAALLIAFPYAITLNQIEGAVFLVAMHSVIHTSSSIPAILFGAPTSASEAATVMDGFPLARAGRASEAIGLIVMASLLGGILGAVGLMILIPLAGQLIGHVGTPEVAALTTLGVISIAALAGGNFAAGLALGAFGLLASTLGASEMTGTPRFVFGSLELWDGLNLAAVVAGLFVVPELTARFSAVEQSATIATLNYRDVWKGCKEACIRWSLVLRSSFIGFIVGFIPGIGASAAVWLAYGHASQTEKSPVAFGAGATAGIIAPEAANNSKEGGALAPALFFGIPGTSGMAILLAAFATLGIEVGPRLLQSRPDFAYGLGWTVIIANVLAVPIAFLAAPICAHRATANRREIVPIAIALAVLAALLVFSSPVTIVQILVFSVLGIALAATRLPRAPFLLGLVVGRLFELSYLKTAMIYGPSAMLRPGVAIILCLSALIIVLARRNQVSAKAAMAQPLRGSVLVFGVLLLFCGSAALETATFPKIAALLPATAIVVVAAASVLAIFQTWRNTHNGWFEFKQDGFLVLAVFGLLAAIPIIGFAAAAGVFVAASIWFVARRGVIAATCCGLAMAAVGYSMMGLR